MDFGASLWYPVFVDFFVIGGESRLMPDPVLFVAGPFSIRWYGALVVSGMIIGAFIACLEARRQKINIEHFINMCLMLMVAGVLGARAYYVAFNWDYYGQDLIKILAFREGGLAIHGGLIAGGLAMAISGIYYGVGAWRSLDITAPSAVLAQSIGRWGNFFNQEAYGYQVDPGKIPWAMFIDGAYRHPTFLYESIWDLLVFFFLLWYRGRRNVMTGDVCLMYFILYSCGRLVIEGFRVDSLRLGVFRVAQVVSVAAIFLSLFVMYARHKSSEPGARISSLR